VRVLTSVSGLLVKMANPALFDGLGELIAKVYIVHNLQKVHSIVVSAGGG
jgi:hypothetical protein